MTNMYMMNRGRAFGVGPIAENQTHEWGGSQVVSSKGQLWSTCGPAQLVYQLPLKEGASFGARVRLARQSPVAPKLIPLP